MSFSRVVLCLALLLCFCATPVLSSPASPQSAKRHFRGTNPLRAIPAPNPLYARRQVNAENIRRGTATKRQACPTPQPSGGCCPSGQTLCIDTCVDLTSDQNNCGYCGEGCSVGSVCEDSQCVGCGFGDYGCNNVCTPVYGPNASPDNCGACGIVCASGSCNDGSCCPTSDPDICSGVCVNILDSDPSNCGACGRACSAVAYCSSGSCLRCQASFTRCPDTNTCINLLNDASACGSCGNACASGACLHGSCCPTSEPDICGSVCTNTLTDHLNCATCGHACVGDNTICNSGTCQTCSPGSLRNCNNVCTDLENDPTNCGECGRTCQSGRICSNGVCCSEGYSYCSGSCIPTTADRDNCGGCSVGCGADQTCTSSICTTCASGGISCNNVCVSPAAHATCGGCTACASGDTCYTLSGADGTPNTYTCQAPGSYGCEGRIQVWRNDLSVFFGYLSATDNNGLTYGYDSTGTTFAVPCGGGSQTNIFNLNVGLTFLCASESDDYPNNVFYINGCTSPTGPGSQPTSDQTDVTASSSTRLAETAIWGIDSTTVEITVDGYEGPAYPGGNPFPALINGPNVYLIYPEGYLGQYDFDSYVIVRLFLGA